MEGLKRLEYRGYDSAGRAVYAQEGFQLAKTVGRVANLTKEAARSTFPGTLSSGF